MIVRPRPPRGALSTRVVSTAPASDTHGRRESVRTGRRGGGGVAEQVGRQVEAGVQCAVKYGETEAV